MQIHELTAKKKIDESFMGDLAKAAGNTAKGVVGGAVQGVKDKAGQLGAQMKDPKAWFDTKAATAAKGGAQLKQQSSAFIKQMAAEWPAVAKTITANDALSAKQTPTLRQAPQKTTATNTPAPKVQGGSELQKAQAAGSPARLAVGDKRSELQIAAEPNSIANRQLAKDPNKPAVPGEVQSMDDYAKQNPKNKYHDVTGEMTPYGKQQQADLDQKLKAKYAADADKYKQQSAQADADYADTVKMQQQNDPANPAYGMKIAKDLQAQELAKGLNLAKGLQGKAPAEEPISIGGQKLNPKNPKDAKLIAQLKAKGLQEAFSDLPGAKPAPGNAVDPKVTKSVGKQGNPLTSAYITKFKQWSDGKLSTRESNTGEEINMDMVRKEMPELDRALNTALSQVYNTRRDPDANQQAVTAYLSQALSATQKIASKKRQENPKSQSRSNTNSAPGQMDPQTAKLASAMGLAQTNLHKMKQVIDSQSEKVTQGTGSPTIDNLLVAAGLLK